jgi:hypothetical protein
LVAELETDDGSLPRWNNSVPATATTKKAATAPAILKSRLNENLRGGLGGSKGVTGSSI